MSRNRNNKTNTSSNLEVKVMDIAAVTSDTMLSQVINETDLQIARESNEVENVNTETGTAVLNPKLRDYYLSAYEKLDKLGGNVLLAKRKMIVAVVDSEDFKKSFVNDKDFAESIGESKTAISKAKSCIKTLKWLTDNGFGSDWTPSQLDEITPVLNKELKKDEADSFKTMLVVLHQHMEFTESTSTRRIREIMSNVLFEYNKLVEPEPENNSNDESEYDESEYDESNYEFASDDSGTKESSAKDSESADTSTDPSTDPSTEDNTDEYKEVKFKELEISLTLENGMKCTIVGKSTKNSADKVYKQIRDMIQSNEIIKAEIMKILKNVM